MEEPLDFASMYPEMKNFILNLTRIHFHYYCCRDAIYYGDEKPVIMGISGVAKEKGKIAWDFDPLILLQHAGSFHSQSAIVSLVTALEVYLEDKFYVLLKKDPRILMSLKELDGDKDDRRFHVQELLQNPEEKVIDLIPKLYVKQKDFKRMEKVEKMYKAFFNIDIYKDIDKKTIHELIARRNVIVHRGGIIENKAVCEECNYSHRCIGGTAIVKAESIKKYIDTIINMVGSIQIQASKGRP